MAFTLSLHTPSPTSGDAPRQFFRLVQDTPPSSTIPDLSGLHRLEIPDFPVPDTGQTRSRLVYVFIPDTYTPPARDAQGKWPCPGGYPLTFTLHGSGQTADDFQNNYTNLITQCNNQGVILIIPQGAPNPTTGKYG